MITETQMDCTHTHIHNISAPLGQRHQKESVAICVSCAYSCLPQRRLLATTFLQATLQVGKQYTMENCNTYKCMCVCCEYVRMKLKGILLSSVLHICAPQPIVNVSHAMTVVMPLRHKLPFTGCNAAPYDSITPHLA